MGAADLFPSNSTLTDDYKFSSGESSVSVEFDGNKGNMGAADLFLGFGDGTNYFTFVMDFDGKLTVDMKDYGIYIYPSCDGGLASGDISDALVGMDNAVGNSNFYKLRSVLAGGDYNNWHRLTTGQNKNNWPVKVTVTNDLEKQKSTFRVVTDQIDLQCSFTSAFAADTELKFGLVPDMNDDVVIEEFTVTKSGSITTSEVLTPTSDVVDGLAVTHGEWSTAASWNFKGDATAPHQWAMALTLDDDFQFSTLDSMITIEFDGDTGSESESDLFMGFGDGTRYFAFAMDFDEALKMDGDTVGIFIYPSCDGALASGDVGTVLDGIDGAAGGV